MGLYDELGLDPNMDRNSFTKEDAAKAFEKAAQDLRSGVGLDETVDKLLDMGFAILKIISGTV